MRRITKFGSIAIALLIGVPAFLSLGFFDGASAAGPPLLYSETTDDPVMHIAFPPESPRDRSTYGYVLQTDSGDRVTIRERASGGKELHTWNGGARVTSFATDRDGSDYVFGTDTGKIVFVTSKRLSVDTEITYDTGSPITSVAVEPGGNWYTATTYHGDVYFFHRQRLIDTGTFVWHHKAPLPVGAAPTNPDAYPDPLKNLDKDVFGEISLRPYSHVTFGGSANPNNPTGLFVIAITAFGELWVFDTSQGVGPEGASAMRPETHHIGDAECETIDVSGMEIEVPCNRKATDRLLAQLDSLTGSTARPVFDALRQALSQAVILDPIYGVIPSGVEIPVLGVKATQGSSAKNGHLIVVARTDGEVHGIGVHRGPSVPSPNEPTRLDPLWRLQRLGSLTSFTISDFTAPAGSGKVHLLVGDVDGRVQGFIASGIAAENPAVDFTHDTDAGAVRALSIVRAQVTITRYFAYLTETSTMGLFDLARRSDSGFPTEIWSGSASGVGNATGIAVSHTGSVLASKNGLALYAGIPSVRIDAPSGIKKGVPFQAHAKADAPDSAVVAYDWVLQPPNGGVSETFSGESIDLELSTEGRHGLTITITDSNGFQSKAATTITAGGTPPVLKMSAPSRAATHEPVTYDFNGTHDPDAAQGLGISRIELYPFGNGTLVEVPLDTLKVELTYSEIGTFTADATAYDLDGRATTAQQSITINDGGWCIVEGQSSDKGCQEPPPPSDDDPIEDPEGGDGNDTSNTDPIAKIKHTIDGFVLRVDGSGSSDPDGDPLTYRWHFGDGTRISGATATHTYAVAGHYTVHLVVEDGRGGQGTATITVAIQLCGPPSPSPASGLIPYTRLVIAQGTGHTLSYGAAGGNAGRFDIRSPSGGLLYREPSGGPAVASAAITKDGCHIYLGRDDGTVLYVNVTDPSDRKTVRLFDIEKPISISHTAVAQNGRQVLFATTPGHVILSGARLASWPGNHTIPGEIQNIVADRGLYNVVIHTTDGKVHLIDGHGRKPDHRATYDYRGEATALEITPSVDSLGRGWLFIGRSDGQLSTVKLQGHQFYVAGSVTIQEGVPVIRIESTPLDRESHYRLGIVTSSTRTDCGLETDFPCGQLSFIDSRGPMKDDLPVVKKKTSLDRPAQGFAMNPEARHFLIVGESRSTIDRYDMIWKEPLQTMNGFPSTIRSIVMADTSNAYALLGDGRIVWFYAPPIAEYRAGTHDGSGIPQWDERLTAKRETTFDPSPSRSGVGRIVAYQWDFGDGTTSSDPKPVHRYAVQGSYLVTLTVTSRVSTGAETLLVDRYTSKLLVWDPPPVAKLVASPYDEATNAVNITSGQTVHFDASGSYDAHGGRIVYYRFLFGDGGSGGGSSPQRSHTYTRGGIFYASATVTDDQGFSTTSDKIRIIVANRAPTASFGWSQPERNETAGWVTQGVPVRFDGGTSSDPDGRVQEYEWTFPGGITKTGEVVWHTFGATGNPTVSLRVRDNSGSWSISANSQIVVDDGIRLRHTQDPASGRTINPTEKVTATGFVHDFSGYPDTGNGIPNVKVYVRVYYDGPLGSDPATRPYETKTHLTDSGGNMMHEVAYNQGVAFKPGKYRIQLTAVLEGSLNGDTEYSQTSETHFVVA